MPESLAERVDEFAVRTLLRANELLGLALGVQLAKLRLAGAFAQSEANALQARLFSEIRPDRRRAVG